MIDNPMDIVIGSINHDGRSLLAPVKDAASEAVMAYSTASITDPSIAETKIYPMLKECEDAVNLIEQQMEVVTKAFRLQQDGSSALRQVKTGVQGLCIHVAHKASDIRAYAARMSIADSVIPSSRLVDTARELSAFVDKLVAIGERIVDTHDGPVRLETEFCRALEDVRDKHLGVHYTRLGGKIKGTIFANRGAVYLLFREILSNSFKYRSSKRLLHISTISIEQNDNIVVTISDNGIGMDQSHCESEIFRPGVRLPEAQQLDRERHTTGQGLGLSIVRRIIAHIKASMKVFSELDKGTKFEIIFSKL